MTGSLEVLDSTEHILTQKVPYFTRLNSSDREKFLDRLTKFISGKEFITREQLDIPAGMEEIRTMISAAAVQVTFGLDEFELPHFTKIFIYPREYYNHTTHHWHKGEANVLGALVFSWKALKEGFAEEHDKINLGLHEMAHALLLSSRLEDENDPFFVQYFDKWWSVSYAEFVKLEKHQASFFRDYGGTNSQEFFAVCVECFFEAPDEFKEKHPEIYRQTCILLNQDPTANANDLTKARSTLLESTVIEPPHKLNYKTQGRTLTNLLVTVGGVGLYFILIGSVAINALSLWNISLLSIFTVCTIILIVRFMKYTEFYVYDNAFAIGYERHGESLDKQISISAPYCISISFYIAENRRPARIRVKYVKDESILTSEWNYGHIKANQVPDLKESVKQYCIKNNIGFHDNK